MMSGCIFTNKGKVDDKYVVVTALQGMNHDSALTADVVQVTEEYVWNQLVSLDSSEYFKRRKWIAMKGVKIWTIEITADFWSRAFLLKGYMNNAIGTVLFANYPESKLNKIRLKSEKDCTIINCGVDQITKAESCVAKITNPVVIEPMSA